MDINFVFVVYKLIDIVEYPFPTKYKSIWLATFF